MTPITLPAKAQSLVDAKAVRIEGSAHGYVATFRDGQRMFFDKAADRKEVGRSIVLWDELTRH